jgi:hypothetical protein
MLIHRCDLADILGSLPGLTTSQPKNPRLDVLIVTLGFEDRTAAVTRQLAAVGALGGARLLVITYPTNEEENAAHLEDFEQAARSTGGIEYFRYERDLFNETIASRLRQIPAGSSVGFDLSTCSSYVFYRVMKVLVGIDIRLCLYYTEAEIYYPTKEEWEGVASRAASEGSLFVKAFEDADFQTQGVECVYPFSLFSEMNAGNRPSGLVAIPNFSAVRMNAIINRDKEINKTPFRNVHWVLGTPPADANAWRADAVRRTQNLANVSDRQMTRCSTLDYKEMFEVLENIWLRWRYSLQMSIANLGSKLQHVGAFCFLVCHEDVGMWLAEPSRYQSSKFSRGVGNAWHLDLGSTQDLMANLRKYMSLTWSF